MLFFAEIPPWGIWGAGLVALTWVVLRLVMKWRESEQKSESRFVRLDAKANRKSQGMDDAPDSLLQWEVAMHETARDLKAEIDTKLAALQTLTKIAAEERLRLEAALRQAQQLELPSRPNLFNDIYSLADTGQRPAAIANQLNLPVGDVELALSLRVGN